MTDNIDIDALRQKQNNQPMLPFPGNELDRFGMRLTRAEFARFMEVSKQAVGDWVKSGKIMLGADGRLDPRQAVSQLLRSTDPARLRSKVLAPLLRDVGTYRQRIADLEKELALSNENEKFTSDSFSELSEIIETLVLCLRFEWGGLRKLDTDTALVAIEAWLNESLMHGTDPNLEILSFDPTSTKQRRSAPVTPVISEEDYASLEEIDRLIKKGIEDASSKQLNAASRLREARALRESGAPENMEGTEG